VAVLLTRRGRDVYLAKYSLIEFDLGRVSKAASTANATDAESHPH